MAAVNGGDAGVKLIAVNTAFLAVAGLCVHLRLWSRKQRHQALHLNDWLIVVALLCQVLTAVLDDVNVALGSVALGPHEASSSGAKDISLQLSMPTAILWGLPLLFIRLSILQYYYEKVKYVHFRALTIVIMVVIFTFFIAYVIVVGLNCIPVTNVATADQEPTCIDQSDRLATITGVNVGMDGVVLLLALPVLGLARQSSRRFWLGALTLLFGLGVCATAGMRLLYLSQSDTDTTMNFHLTSLLEANTGTIVACLPLLWPVARRVWYGTGTPTELAHAPPAQTHMLRHTPGGSESTLMKQPTTATTAAVLVHRENESKDSWPLPPPDPELGLLRDDDTKHPSPRTSEPSPRTSQQSRRSPRQPGSPREPTMKDGVERATVVDTTPRRASVGRAVHVRVSSGGAKLVHVPANAKRGSTEDHQRALEELDRVRKERASSQVLPASDGGGDDSRRTSRDDRHTASWDSFVASRQSGGEATPRAKIDTWFDDLDSEPPQHDEP